MQRVNIFQEILTILQVQQTSLADIFHLAACLTNFCFLEAHPDTRTPAEHREGTSTDLTTHNITTLEIDSNILCRIKLHGTSLYSMNQS